MKKQLLNLSVALVAVLFAVAAFAQDREAEVLYSLDCAAAIDGVAEVTWNDLEAFPIDQVFQSETPTLTSAIWKAFYNDTAIFILYEIIEDEFLPSWISLLATWQSDLCEIYFDVNAVLDDGVGAAGGAGHFQFSNNWLEADGGLRGGITQNGTNMVWSSDTYDGNGHMILEYTVGFASLLDDTEAQLDPVSRSEIGFDATTIDLDEAFEDIRQRMVWNNVGAVDESWNNLDDAGLFIFSVDEIATCDDTEDHNAEPVGIRNITLDESVSIIGDQITFDELVDIKIYSMTGAVVLQQTNVENVNLSKLSRGVYVGVVNNESSFKFVY
ncbi:MAG: T9SS type A sorting domain-containing protein [Bacteroidales bacterium]|nr:T9SS type A sorting domain-containing protein [Bacteroidales bacterium]